MPRRRALQGVLDNFLSSFTSRYTEYDGYWLFGQLRHLRSHVYVDLLASARPDPDDVTWWMARRAQEVFRLQVERAGFSPAAIHRAYLSIIPKSESVTKGINGRWRSGLRVVFRARVVTDLGREYERTLTCFVAPHDPDVDRRSGGGPYLSSRYTIRPAASEHVALLPSIERAAARLFPAGILPPAHLDRTVPVEVLERAQIEGRLWVALEPEGVPVGFAFADAESDTDAEGDTAHLLELAVHPDHGRQGVGQRLVGAVLNWAEGQRAVVLTTFADIPWNAPFYERLGFRRLGEAELSPALARTLREEAADGLRNRVAMQLDLPEE